MNDLIKQLDSYILKHDELKQKMKTADNYYRQGNEKIMEAKKTMGIKRGDKYHQVENPFASNIKLPSGFLKQQVKQKTNYLINEKMTLTKDEEEVKELFPEWRKDIKYLAEQVSLHIYGAWLFYVNNGTWEKKFVDGKELYPIFETNSKRPDKILRHYVDYNNVEKAELYDNKTKKVFVKNKKKWEFVNEVALLSNKTLIGDEVVREEIFDLEVVPFAICYNNNLWTTDLNPIKRHVDVYDKVYSDLGNNIVDFQDIFYTLKNYHGQDLDEFLNQIKKLKAVPVGEDGDVKATQIEVPIDSKERYLNILRANIFEFGMAVDTKEIAAGNSTNIAIQSMFENLNMKATDFEQELQDFWKQVQTLTNKFNEFFNIGYRLDNEIVFDKTMLANSMDKAKENKVKAETLNLTSAFLDDETLAEIVSNMEFITEYSDISKDELIERLQKETDAIKIEE